MYRGNIKNVISTLIQIVVGEFIWIVFLLSISETLTNILFDSFQCLIIPVIIAMLVFCVKNRKNLKFKKENLKSKSSYTRLFSRLAVVFVFLAIQFILERLDAANRLSGITSLHTLPYLLCNVMLSIIVSLYPVTYGLLELLFTDTMKKTD